MIFRTHDGFGSEILLLWSCGGTADGVGGRFGLCGLPMFCCEVLTVQFFEGEVKVKSRWENEEIKCFFSKEFLCLYVDGLKGP